MAIVLKEDDPQYQTAIEAGFIRQYELAREYFPKISEANFQLTHDFVCELNRVAVEFLTEHPGEYRHHPNANVTIRNAKHQPMAGGPGVKVAMDNFIDRVNRDLNSVPGLEQAAYVLWRLNWIHPFMEGNGRTARILSFILLCRGFGGWLPGQKSIPQLIRDDRRPYYEALEHCDAHCDAQGNTDLSKMVALLERLLVKQLTE